MVSVSAIYRSGPGSSPNEGQLIFTLKSTNILFSICLYDVQVAVDMFNFFFVNYRRCWLPITVLRNSATWSDCCWSTAGGPICAWPNSFVISSTKILRSHSATFGSHFSADSPLWYINQLNIVFIIILLNFFFNPRRTRAEGLIGPISLSTFMNIFFEFQVQE